MSQRDPKPSSANTLPELSQYMGRSIAELRRFKKWGCRELRKRRGPYVVKRVEEWVEKMDAPPHNPIGLFFWVVEYRKVPSIRFKIWGAIGILLLLACIAVVPVLRSLWSTPSLIPEAFKIAEAPPKKLSPTLPSDESESLLATAYRFWQTNDYDNCARIFDTIQGTETLNVEFKLIAAESYRRTTWDENAVSRIDRAIEFLEAESISLVGDAKSPLTKARIDATIAALLIRKGDMSSGFELFNVAFPKIEAADSISPERKFTFENNYFEALLLFSRKPRAKLSLERLEALAHKIGSEWAERYVTILRAKLLFREGKLELALKRASEATDWYVSNHPNDHRTIGMGKLLLAEIYHSLRNPDLAQDAIDSIPIEARKDEKFNAMALISEAKVMSDFDHSLKLLRQVENWANENFDLRIVAIVNSSRANILLTRWRNDDMENSLREIDKAISWSRNQTVEDRTTLGEWFLIKSSIERFLSAESGFDRKSMLNDALSSANEAVVQFDDPNGVDLFNLALARARRADLLNRLDGDLRRALDDVTFARDTMSSFPNVTARTAVAPVLEELKRTIEDKLKN